MPRFSDRAREELLDEYMRLKAQNISDAQIARRFGVSQMTILRWKQKYGLDALRPERFDATGNVEAPTSRAEAPGHTDQRRFQSHGGSVAPKSGDDSTLRQEVEWLRELAARLLLENERLKAELAGKLDRAATSAFSDET